MHRLFTFVGTGNYHETRYGSEGYEPVSTRFFPVVLARWTDPDEVVVFLTTEAERHGNWEGLRRELEEYGISTRAVSIPSGKSEPELWQIFDAMTGAADEGDVVSFDITHAFRSIPLLGLLASAYLRRARNVELRTIQYGAYEARDPDTGLTPVFDLSPFLALLDWLSSTDKFIQTGDARSLAALLRSAQSDAHRARHANPPRRLHQLASSLESLSLALALARPAESSKSAFDSLDALASASADLDKGHARPFTVLLNRVRKAYSPLADDSLSGQAVLVRWYLERGQIIQAVTLGREWLVSFAAETIGTTALDQRNEVEDALNQLVLQHRGSLQNDTPPLLAKLKAYSESKRLRDAWSLVRELRNDLAHCGFRNQPGSAAKLEKRARKFGEALGQLAVHIA